MGFEDHSKTIRDICETYKELQKDEKNPRDVRYFIKESLAEYYKVVWSESNSDTFMVRPHGKRFGRFIFSKSTYEVLCADIPAVTEEAWNLEKTIGNTCYRMYSGYYVRIYWNGSRWEISMENTESLEDLHGKNSLSATGKVKITEEVEDLLRDKVPYQYMEKNKTYVYVLYSSRLISGIYYGDYEIVNLVATIDNKTAKVDIHEITETPEKEDAIIVDGMIMYSNRYKISTAMIDRYKNLNYILLRNFKNFDNFYRYFPIESWKVQKGKLYNKMVNSSKYIARHINDYQLIKVRLKESGRKVTPDAVMEIFDNLPCSDLAVYLSINVF